MILTRNKDRNKELAISGKKSGFREKVLGGLSARGGESVGFRMLPMIDVLFLLLIFFLITARFHSPESALPFRLPAAVADVVPGKTLPLEINIAMINGKVALKINDTKDLAVTVELSEANLDQDLTRFTNELAAILPKLHRSAGDPVELICDDKVAWLYVAKVYNLLYGMGIQDITFGLSE